MARGRAHDLAADGITVNCLSPGPIETVRGASAGVLPKGVGDNILLGRKGRPEEIAAMVRALCGPAGRFVTGQTNHVNGGAYLTCRPAPRRIARTPALHSP